MSLLRRVLWAVFDVHSPSAHTFGVIRCWCGNRPLDPDGHSRLPLPARLLAVVRRRPLAPPTLLPTPSLVLLGWEWMAIRHPEREAADARCGWTHCNDCCGPCPTCGHEGAWYGDPGR